MDRDAWQRAQTLEDLARATCTWLRGEGPPHPAYSEVPDDETQELVEDLVRINQAGLVTTFSQPAEQTANGSGQRAALEGICDEDLAKRMSTLSLWTDLIVIVHDPEFEGGHYLPITTTDYHAYTWIGRSGTDDLVGPFEKHGCQAIIPVLRRAWKVAVMDPKWGRPHYLWDRVLGLLEQKESLEWKSAPHPELNLGVDFIT